MTVNVPMLPSDSTRATSQSLDSYPRIQFTYDCECTNATIGQCQCYNKSVIRIILGYNLPMTVNVPMLSLDSTSATTNQSLDSHRIIQFTYDCECTNAAIGQCQCFNKSVWSSLVLVHLSLDNYCLIQFTYGRESTNIAF